MMTAPLSFSKTIRQAGSVTRRSAYASLTAGPLAIIRGLSQLTRTLSAVEQDEVRLRFDLPFGAGLLHDEPHLGGTEQSDEHLAVGRRDAFDDAARRHFDELTWTDLDEWHLDDRRLEHARGLTIPWRIGPPQVELRARGQKPRRGGLVQREHREQEILDGVVRALAWRFLSREMRLRNPPSRIDLPSVALPDEAHDHRRTLVSGGVTHGRADGEPTLGVRCDGLALQL